MRIRRPIGVDLGTTNSCVGAMNEMRQEIILFETAGGASTTPSCVWFDERNNEVVVGRDAYMRRGSEPAPVVSVKRSMGKQLLIPLGKASRLPANLPPGVKQALSETREERLRRYLSCLAPAHAAELEAAWKERRAAPPLLWVMNQPERLRIFLAGIQDAAKQEELKKDPPLLWLPEEISALILAEERRQIQSRLRELEPDKIQVADRCLITVPAYFGAEQMEATKEAGALAGLEVLELLQEPSAAAIYYCWKLRLQQGLFMVFDLGGGTFDVSILRLQGRLPQVLGISGNNFLGGDDFDRELAEMIRATAAKENPRHDLELGPEDRGLRDALMFLAEGVKKALSREPDYLLRDTNARDRKGERFNIEMKITQARFETIIAPLVEKCIPKCWEAIAKAKLKAGVSLTDIDQIFLVGGATHVPYVQRVVRERFCGGVVYQPEEINKIVVEIEGDDPEQTAALRELARDLMLRGERARCEAPMIESPDLCVALGAAVQAATYGVEEQGDHASILITSATSVSETPTTVAGKVAGPDLAGATVYLSSQALGVDLETDLEPDGAFLFRGIQLQSDAANTFDLSVLSKKGDELARFSVTIAHVATGLFPPPPVGSPSTVSRPYTLDVLRHGVVTRKVLVNSGASLPIEQSHELAVPDPNKGVIYFNVYQGPRLLKRIEAFVDPATPPGTLITFTFSIGADHLMKATYRIAGEDTNHSVTINPPDSLKPGKQELAKLKDALEQELDYAAPLKRDSFRISLEKFERDLRDAEAKGDDPRFIDRYEQLQGLRDEMQRENVRIKPPWQEFEHSYNYCLAFLDAIKAQQPDYPDTNERENLRTTRDAAKVAFDEKAQDRYSECVNSLQKNRESLEREYHRRLEATVSPAEQAEALIESRLKKTQELLKKADALISRLDSRVKAEPDPEGGIDWKTHLQQCGQCMDDLKKCETGFLEAKAIQTSDPKMATDKCLSFNPILNNAENVLEHKQSILDGKTVADEEQPLPQDKHG